MLDIAAGGQRAGTIEYPDVIKAEKAALEDVHAVGIFSVHPPSEVQQQLVEDALQEFEIAAAARLVAVVLEYAHGGPGVHRRIDVAERPFVGRQLAVRMHQPHLAEEQQLRLGEIRIDE